MPVISLLSLSIQSTSKLPEFSPPPRFDSTTFSSYQPQHPSQDTALGISQEFITASPPVAFRWPWQKPLVTGKGLYLDGGFGVGKTHLLAAAYAAFTGSKAYLSFAELVHVIGVLGKVQALEQLGTHELYCLDEFELDDPGNTLIVKTFLAHVIQRGARVITTSNTAPEAQGQGRFNAQHFQREIQHIANYFEVVSIDGPDYRQRDQLASLLSSAELEYLEKQETLIKVKVSASWTELFSMLSAHHPIRYSDLLRQCGTLYIHDARTIDNQNDALRFVHFIDKLYDLKVGLRLSGTVALEDLFDASYRHSAYAKKHYRCLSRITELLEEIPVLD